VSSIQSPLRSPLLGSLLLILSAGLCDCQCRQSPPTDSDTAAPVDTDTDTDADTDTDTDTETGDAYVLDAPISISLIDNGWPNHLMNNTVTVDEQNDLVFNASFLSGSVAKIDAVTGDLLDMFDLGAFRHTNPWVEVDDRGYVWVSSNDPDTPLVRIDPSDGSLVFPPVSGRPAHGLAPRAGGGVVLSQREGENGVLVAVNPAGDAVDLEVVLDGAVLDLEPFDADSLMGVLTQPVGNSLIQVYDTATLTHQAGLDCEADMTGSELVRADDGSWVIGNYYTINAPSCDGTAGEMVEFGFLATSYIATPHGVIALERHGDEAYNDGALFGLGFRFTTDPLALADVYGTGHNTGYGAYDAERDRLWVNSEGEGALWGIDPATGEQHFSTMMAEHAESILVDQDDPGRLFVAGRLSYLMGSLDLRTQAFERSDDRAFWPMSPTQIGRRVYYYEQIYSKVRGYDMDTLELVADWDLPSTVLNEIHTFGALAYHPTRDSFFVSYSKGSMVIEVDAQTGDELGSWPLAGPTITPTDHGVVEVFLVGDLVYTAVTTTGQITVIDPDQDAIAGEFQLDRVEIDQLTEDNIYLLSYLSKDQSLLYLAGFALDPVTFDRFEGAKDRSITAMVGQYGEDDDIWVGWDARASQAVFMDEDGNELHRLDLEKAQPDEDGHPDIVVDEHWGGRIIYTDMSQADVHVVPIDFL